MEDPSVIGVLGYLGVLEDQSRKRKNPQQSRLKELKDKVEALKVQRDQLVVELEIHEKLQKLRASIDQKSKQEEEEEEEEEKITEDSENSQILQLLAQYSQLRDLLYAHHITGGYNLVKTRQGKGVCISLATAYNDVFMETYNLELNLKSKLTIGRHDIPPFIPLKKLEEENNLQTDLRSFLDTLSQHLNAYVGRKEQLRLVKVLHKTVEVMESNILCSILVLMLTIPRVRTIVLCSLDYSDHTSCLPKRVSLECEDKALPESEEWKSNRSLLMETPVHQALSVMRRMGSIV